MAIIRAKLHWHTEAVLLVAFAVGFTWIAEADGPGGRIGARMHARVTGFAMAALSFGLYRTLNTFACIGVTDGLDGISAFTRHAGVSDTVAVGTVGDVCAVAVGVASETCVSGGFTTGGRAFGALGSLKTSDAACG